MFKRAILSAAIASILTLIPTAKADPVQEVFNGSGVVSKEWTLKELDADLPSDWSSYNFLVLEFRASSPQRFDLLIRTSDKTISKRIHPFQNTLVRAAIPLKYFSEAPSGGNDLASLVNHAGLSYFINIENGGYGPLTNVQAIGVDMHDPLGSPKLEIQSVSLAKDSPGDAVLDPKVIVDEFGQWIPADWPGKVKSLDDLKQAWNEEDQSLGKDPVPDRDKYGGFSDTTANATGFFRVEQIDGKWWFIDPDGHYFWSSGVNGIGASAGTRTAGRETIFATTAPSGIPPGANFGGFGGGGAMASFYTLNLQRRFAGDDWRTQWAAFTVRRLADWGINTMNSRDPALLAATPRQPYVMFASRWQTGQQVLGLADVYAPDFESRVDSIAAQSCEPYKNDPYLIGYFIGNEPSWPGREKQLTDLILSGAESPMQIELKKWLADKGDTLDNRRAFVLNSFERYLTVICAAVKKHDPNHLNLGIRFGGSPPADVIRFGHLFDVYSHNIYSAAPDPKRLAEYYQLTGRPILIGEFHIGVPGRGMAPGLVQAANQEERGQMYSGYVENAAADPNVIGAHWFQWVDEPNTGRNDGEDYNIGFVDVTDRPYPELIAAMKRTGARILDIHSGKLAPATRQSGAEAQ